MKREDFEKVVEECWDSKACSATGCAGALFDSIQPDLIKIGLDKAGEIRDGGQPDTTMLLQKCCEDAATHGDKSTFVAAVMSLVAGGQFTD